MVYSLKGALQHTFNIILDCRSHIESEYYLQVQWTEQMCPKSFPTAKMFNFALTRNSVWQVEIKFDEIPFRETFIKCDKEE